MARQIQIRRGTAAQHENFTGAVGEITMDTTNNTIRVHDGKTMGGTPLAKQSEIANNNINASIIPDYSAGIVMKMELTEQTFTCPANGVIVADTTGFNRTRGYIRINGVTMFDVTTNGNTYFVNGNAQFFVGASDTITYKSGYINETLKPSTNTLTFFPFRQNTEQK